MAGDKTARDVNLESMALGDLVNQMMFTARHFPIVLCFELDRIPFTEDSQKICENYDKLKEELNRRDRNYREIFNQ